MRIRNYVRSWMIMLGTLIIHTGYVTKTRYTEISEEIDIEQVTNNITQAGSIQEIRSVVQGILQDTLPAILELSVLVSLSLVGILASIFLLSGKWKSVGVVLAMVVGGTVIFYVGFAMVSAVGLGFLTAGLLGALEMEYPVSETESGRLTYISE